MDRQHDAALTKLTQSVLNDAPLPALMRQVLELVIHTLDVERAAVWEWRPDGNALALCASVGWTLDPAEHSYPGIQLQFADYASLDCPMPVIIVDWHDEGRFVQPTLLRDHRVASSLYVAVQAQDRLYAMVSADSSARCWFDDQAIQSMQLLANLLALAFERHVANETPEQRVAENLRDILTILNSNRALDESLGYIISQACQVLGASAGAIYRLNSQEALLRIQAASGLDAEDATLPIPVEWVAMGQTLQTNGPAIVSDTLAALSTLEGCATTPPPPELLRLSQRYRALIVVPLIVKDDVYGTITLYYQQPRSFSDGEVRLAAGLSDQAALAIENARLLAAAQDKAVLEERQRLARDLHDSVTQALYGVTLHAEAARRRLASGDLATVASYLQALQETAQEALDEMRLLIFELRPPILEQSGLVAALQARLNAVEGRANQETALTVEGLIALPPALEQALYRIAQEGLNNALKHAHAQRITLLLRQVDNNVVFEMTDDGIGFDPVTARERGGQGLLGMRERAAQLGARLIMQSAPGAGTQLRVEIKL